MDPRVDRYVKSVKPWQAEIEALRDVILQTKLQESLKWGKPCYAFDGGNIVIIQPFKACVGLMFFKGALLKDPKGLLVDNGPNSQGARRLEFTSVRDVAKAKAAIKAYIKEAVALEASGKKVTFRKKPEPVPNELKAMFKREPRLKKAFESLTPGRQRAYILHFSGAKQSATRTARIEKWAPRILAGKGMHDR